MVDTKKCDACTNIVSIQADSCPHCGHPQKKKYGEKSRIVLSILSAIIVPILIAGIGWNYTNKIAGQDRAHSKKMAELEEYRFDTSFKYTEQKDETERKIKYLEIFYKEFYSDKAERKSLALKILRLLDAEMQTQLAPLFQQQQADLPKDLQKQAEEILDTARAKTSLQEKLSKHFNGVSKIEIFFTEDSIEQKRLADRIEEEVLHAGFKGRIKKSQRSSRWFWNGKKKSKYQVRYDKGNENEKNVALFLAKDLFPKEIQKEFDTLSIYNRKTPSYLSIMLQ